MSKHRHDKGNRGPFPASAVVQAGPAVAESPRPLDPFEVLRDYESRSLAHVVGLPEQLDAPGLWRGVGFRIGAHRLASGFGEVVEILPMTTVTARRFCA